MKYLFSLTLALGLTFFAFSQKLDYVVGEPYQVIDAFDKSYFSQNGEIMAVKTIRNAVAIQKWDAGNLKEIKRSVLDDFDKGFQLESIQSFKGKYYYFYSVWDRKEKLEQLYVREIDFDLGVFVGVAKRLLYVEGKVTNALGGEPGVVGGSMFAMFGTVGKFNIQRSYDNSKFLVQYRKDPDKKRDKVNFDRIGFTVFDHELNELSHSEIEMPYTEQRLEHLDYSIDADGNAYLLAKVYKSDKQSAYDKDGKINYHLELLKLPVGTSQISATPVEVEGIAVTELLLFGMPSNEMLCTGYYTNSKNTNHVSGVIVFKVDDSGRPSRIQTYPIPLEVINMYRADMDPENLDLTSSGENMDLADLQIRNLYVFDDGSLLINGEQHDIKKRTVGSGSRTQTVYVYHYDDVLSTRIDGDGELRWMKRLNKSQMGARGKGGLSFKHFASENSQYYMFLDNIQNMDLSLERRPVQHVDGQGGYFSVYKLDDLTGKVSRESLFDVHDVHGVAVSQFSVDRIIPVAPGVVCIEVYKSLKEDVLLKVGSDIRR